MSRMIEYRRFKILMKPFGGISLVKKIIFQSIRNSEPLINEVHQPRRTDEKKLNVLKEGRFFTFDFMTIELTYQRKHKDDDAYKPQRRHVEQLDLVHHEHTEHSEKKHSDA